MRRDETVEAMAVCHAGAGSEAGSDVCYVKFAAVRPGEGGAVRFERLLDACEAFAAESGLGRLVAGVNTGRLDAYRHLLARGYRTQTIGVSMWLHPERPHFHTPTHYVHRRPPLTAPGVGPLEPHLTAASVRHPSWYELRATSE